MLVLLVFEGSFMAEVVVVMMMVLMILVGVRVLKVTRVVGGGQGRSRFGVGEVGDVAGRVSVRLRRRGRDGEVVLTPRWRCGGR